MTSFFSFLSEHFLQLLAYSGYANITVGSVVMLALAVVLIFLAIKREWAPMLLLPIGFGILIANVPFKEVGLQLSVFEKGSIFNYLFSGIEYGWYPPLIFLGIGAMTDFSALIANPKLMLIGFASQIGVFSAYIGALTLGFGHGDAGPIGIAALADGPTAIFLASRLSPTYLSAIAISAYIFLALIPVIQPPLMKLLTNGKERVIRMQPLRAVSRTEKVLFPIVGLILTSFLVPAGLPLLGMLFFGNILKESGVTRRLADTAKGPMLDVLTILIGFAVGISTQSSQFLTLNTVKVFILALVSFIVATVAGIVIVKVMNLFLKEDNKINPLIGNAGVSGLPESARISQVMGLKYDKTNHLLSHAMGPAVAGVIGSTIAAGILLGFLM